MDRGVRPEERPGVSLVVSQDEEVPGTGEAGELSRGISLGADDGNPHPVEVRHPLDGGDHRGHVGAALESPADEGRRGHDDGGQGDAELPGEADGGVGGAQRALHVGDRNHEALPRKAGAGNQHRAGEPRHGGKETRRVQADAREEGRFAVVDHHAAGVGPRRREGIVAGHDAGEAVGGDPEVGGGLHSLGRHDPEAARPGGAEQILRFPPSDLGEFPLREHHDVAPELEREERLALAEELRGAGSHFRLAGDQEAVPSLDHRVAVGNDETVAPVDPRDEPLPGAEVPELHVHRRRGRQHLDLPDLPAAEAEAGRHLVGALDPVPDLVRDDAGAGDALGAGGAQHSGAVRLPERADGGRTGVQFGRHPADFDIDAVLVGGGDHPLRAVAGGVPKGEGAGPVAKKSLERLVRRVLAQPFQLLRVGVKDRHAALAGKLAREFAACLPGADDDDPGEVVRQRRFALRGGFREAFRHGGKASGRATPSDPTPDASGSGAGVESRVRRRANR